MIRAQFDNMPVSVSLDYSPNPVRSWAFFMCSQEWCMTWARSRNIAKSPQTDNWFQGAIYADKSQWDREATGHWSSSMQTGPHLPWIQEVIRAGRQLVYQNAQSFPFSLLSTQDVPIRKKKMFKNQSHSSPQRFASQEKESLHYYLKSTFFTIAHNFF